MLKPQEAEEEKRKMSTPIQELVKTAISPLAREIRSSIDFFERQNDHRVAQNSCLRWFRLFPGKR